MMIKKKILLLVLWLLMLPFTGAATITTQPASFPEYRFQSTSTCPSVVGSSAFTTTMVYTPYSAAPRTGLRRTESWSPGSWDDGDPWDGPGEDDYPTGVLPNPAPVGEPLILLLMAMLYAAGRYIARRKHIIFYNKQ